jgi:hypothetical protein
MSEAAVQQEIRLEAARRSTPLLRNNNGACYDDRGRLVRYGLGNDSSKINKVFKSSDLIGIYPIMITPEMVGSVVGQFFAVEVKPTTWQYRATDERAAAQWAFGQWVQRHGGRFTFARGTHEVWI